MSIQFTTDQVTTMAPDSSSMAAGKKLANKKHWKSLGYNEEALWGECQGSALYQVRVELSTLTVQCSCPSRKQPCKHGLGLLLLTTTAPSAIEAVEAPEWITAWLAKRVAASKRKEAKPSSQTSGEPTAAQKKTAEKRLAQVNKGLEHLDLWLNDLVRNGLGSLETQPDTFWQKQAAQMVDAQAQGIASRLRRIAAIPNSSPNWPEKLLARLGQLALLSQAFHRIEQLDPALQEDVRQLVGWTLKEEDVITQGERITDDWLILGQASEEAPRGRSQRTWLIGKASRRVARIDQFAPPGGVYPQLIPCGACWHADLVYWPSASPQRALIENRHTDNPPIAERLPGSTTIEDFLGHVSGTLAQQPWSERFLCILNDTIPLYDDTAHQWMIRDSAGQGLPLTKGEHWKILSLSGGMPVDFVGEWNGEALLPLGMLVDNAYYTA